VLDAAYYSGAPLGSVVDVVPEAALVFFLGDWDECSSCVGESSFEGI